jgi:hypothetical protein
MNPVSTYAIGHVTIEKFAVDWNDLTGPTALRLNALMQQPGSGYVNPEYTVRPNDGATTAELVRMARRAQVLWNKRLARTLGSAARKRLIKRAKPLFRQPQFTGILVIDGHPVPPTDWPDAQVKPAADTSPTLTPRGTSGR